MEPGPSSSSPKSETDQKKERLKLENEAKRLKKLEMILILKKKKECEKRAQDIVLRLIEPEVSSDYLLENAKFIAPRHFEDIFEERRLIGTCGWPLCDSKLGPIPKQTYSIRNNKVLDITERKNFCSANCYAKASNFKGQLLTTPLWLRDKDDEETNKKFTILESDSKELHGLVIPLNNLDLGDVKNE